LTVNRLGHLSAPHGSRQPIQMDAEVAPMHFRTLHVFVLPELSLHCTVANAPAAATAVAVVAVAFTMKFLIWAARTGSGQSLVLFDLDVALYETRVSLVTCEVSVEASNVPPAPIDDVHCPHAPLDRVPSATTSWYSTWFSGSLAVSDSSDVRRLVWITCTSDGVGATVGMEEGSKVGTMDGFAVGLAVGVVLGATLGTAVGFAVGTADGTAEGTAEGFAEGA
jgi:hypothetical protein